MNRILLCAGLLSALLAVGTRAAEKENAFTEQVRTHFKQWDLNRDGKLEHQEVEELLCHSAIKDDQAAALAAIHVAQRSHRDPRTKDPFPLTLAEIVAPGTEGPAERPDQEEKRPHFRDNFLAFRKHLQKVPRELFVDKAPTLDEFKQGHIGDCFFLAAVSAAVHRNPKAVRDLFHVERDGSCEIRFAGATVHVKPLTDGQIVLGSNAGEQGLWLNTLEQGFGWYLRTHHKRGGNSPSPIVALDVLNSGGSSQEAIEALTGHRAGHLSFRVQGKVPEGRQFEVLAREAAGVLRGAVEHRRLVCCGTGSVKHTPGIATNHAYAVLGFDDRKGLVTVRNPWGNKFTPRGEPGLQNGYPTTQGVFEVPLPEFIHLYGGINFELAERYP